MKNEKLRNIFIILFNIPAYIILLFVIIIVSPIILTRLFYEYLTTDESFAQMVCDFLDIFKR